MDVLHFGPRYPPGTIRGLLIVLPVHTSPAPMRLSLLLLALIALPACDSNSYNDGYDDGYNNAPSSAATFVDFGLDGTRYNVSTDNLTATFRSRNISTLETRNAVERALATAGDGALVMLYIKSYLVSTQSASDDPTFSALPVSRGFDERLVATLNPDGTPGPLAYVVGLTASYEFSFDNNDLYFDVVSSKPSTDFGTSPQSLFNTLVPQATKTDGSGAGPDRLEFRLVTVPARAGKRPDVDMTDYAAVARAYTLPN